jgi:hypothetical protein
MTDLRRRDYVLRYVERWHTTLPMASIIGHPSSVKNETLMTDD